MADSPMYHAGSRAIQDRFDSRRIAARLVATVEATRPDGDRKIGVIWHTQGSGKSFSMIFFAQKALRKVSGRYSFLDVTDRIIRTLHDLTREPEAMTHPQGTQLRVSRQELSRLVGCSREMAGRVLKKLEADGKLHARGKTVVVYGTR